MHLYNEVKKKEKVRMQIDELAANSPDVPEQKSCTSPHDGNRRIY
jgi:hypothetical protein